MKQVIWTLPNGFQLPMVKPDEGPMLILAKSAAGALGCTARTLWRQMLRHAQRLRVTDCLPKEFLAQHREAFGLVRVRNDLKVLTDADFLYLSAHIQTEQAVGLHQSYIDFIIQQSRIDMVSREEYEALQRHYNQLEENYQKMEGRIERLEKANPFLDKSASLAGSLLSAQRGTKGIRGLN